ncbi:HET-domain-containing protein [Xylariaceae sp. FL1019]|nr:HET-domain-containing protein [Xylariaceae sp. FL1019]
MHLINAHTLRLEKFVKEENERPVFKYAILSHRWLDRKDEVSFQEMESAEPIVSLKKGYSKISETSRLARSRSLDYIWIDTCCINKTDSSELQEAINSMYRWYQNATVCYAHLADTVLPAGECDLTSVMQHDPWFTRGWTLQEFIAPRALYFLDSDWRLIGTKEELCNSLIEITGIDRKLIWGVSSLDNYSIAQRMSWACGRFTTRPEDSAYSLFGIFGINMPMLYGEGRERAFIRLQEEIIKSSDDESIFAWEGETIESGLLARNLEFFWSCGNVEQISPLHGRKRKNHPYSMTNRGLHITLPLKPCTLNTYYATLNCSTVNRVGNVFAGPSLGIPVWILLRRLDTDDQYMRIPTGTWKVTGTEIERPARQVSMYIPRTRLSLAHVSPCQRQFDFRVHLEKLHHATLQFQPERDIWSRVWENDDTETPGSICLINVSFDFDFNPVVIMAERSADPELLNWIRRGIPDTVVSGDGLSPSPDRPFNFNRMHACRGYPPFVSIEEHDKHHGLWAIKGPRAGYFGDFRGVLSDKGVGFEMSRSGFDFGFGEIGWDLRIGKITGWVPGGPGGFLSEPEDWVPTFAWHKDTVGVSSLTLQ